MTNEEREAVVELLRCAWDQSESIACTGESLGVERLLQKTAIAARCHVQAENYDNNICGHDYYDECLEAAARVEEGSYP